MDFTQNKLTKSEWDSLELPVSSEELKILRLIVEGYENINIKQNDTKSLNGFIQFEQSDELDYFLYKKYFEVIINKQIKKYGKGTGLDEDSEKFEGKIRRLKSSETTRLEIIDGNIQQNKEKIFEYVLIELFNELLKSLYKKRNFGFYLYTIIQIQKGTISSINKYVLQKINKLVEYGMRTTKIIDIINNAYEFIEKNNYLLKYEDKELFHHQKELFNLIKEKEEGEYKEQLILYTAPTGTGKTLSPLGMSNNRRIIFVCVARHIGLALAKAAINVNKKVAFAFGCETASDIRLHYFAAKNYTVNNRSGGIWKVDNSVGDNVEIMICDVQSYLVSMHYMMSFNDKNNIVTYWDEPTITLDYEEHSIHELISKNWKENQIPTVVLSCATLPEMDEISEVLDDYRGRFGGRISRITSSDCKKSISMLNSKGYCVLPHYLYENYEDMIRSVNNIKKNKTILRYFDLREIIRFLVYINNDDLLDDEYTMSEYFERDIKNITMNSLKEYYLEALCNLEVGDWEDLYKYMIKTREYRYSETRTNLRKSQSLELKKENDMGKEISRTKSVGYNMNNVETNKKQVGSSGILITTEDAYTLTDGPTIFLADNVDSIGKFYIKQSNITPRALNNIMEGIEKNDELLEKIEKLEREIVAKEEKASLNDDSKKVSETGRLSRECQEWQKEINKLKGQIRSVSLSAMYQPNTVPHQELWTPNGEVRTNAFVGNISEEMTKEIMMLNIEVYLKVLLLLGIGMFLNNPNKDYMEIMKKLAVEQKLYMIIASTDYIYGTNYQFCHGFIGKDLSNMTQQKILQSMGRVGRNKIQQEYTVRFRDDNMIKKILEPDTNNIEVMNFNRLFVS